MKKKVVTLFNTPNIPEPAGHYSQAVIHGNLIYISGQLPLNPFSGEKIEGPVEDQARQVLENINTILRDAGSCRENVIRCTVYISDIKHWPEVNRIYAGFFGSHKPARAIVPVNELHHGFKVEIDAIAVI